MAMTAPCSHNYGLPKVLRTSDCATHGTAELTCTDCGFVTTQALALDSSAHDLQTATVKEPLCGTPGQSKTFCTRCSYAQHHDLPALEHQFQEVKLVKATCMENGEQVLRCAHCGLEEAKKLHATGKHRYKEGSPYCIDCNWKDPHWMAYESRPNSSGYTFDFTGDFTGESGGIPTFPVIQWDLRPSPNPGLYVP